MSGHKVFILAFFCCANITKMWHVNPIGFHFGQNMLALYVFNQAFGWKPLCCPSVAHPTGINNAYFDGLYRLITNGKIGDSLLLLQPRWKLFFLFTPGFGHGARAAAMDELRLYYCFTNMAGVLMVSKTQLSDCFRFACFSQPACGEDFVHLLSARGARPRNRLGCFGLGSSLASGGGCCNLGRSIGRWLG